MRISPLILYSIVLFFSSSTIADQIHAAKINAELGLAYLSHGLYSPAKERLMDALRDDAHSAESWYSMAFYLEKTGNNRAANKYYEKAISVEPHSGAAKNNYGTFLCRQKHYPESIQLFLSAAGESAYLHADMAYENAGICAMKIPDYINAKKYLLMALKCDPEKLNTLLQLAKLNRDIKNNSRAHSYFSQFIMIAKKNNSDISISQCHHYVFGNAP